MGQSFTSAESRAARRAHYAAYYGDEALPEDCGVVIGNCQAESLRICLDAPDLRLVRVPAIHEIPLNELPLLHRVIAASRVVISQPIRDDFHGLPLGTTQLLTSASSAARVAIMPVVRHRALYPQHVVVRFHQGPEVDPPIVPYHDLRVMATALGVKPVELTPALVRSIAAESTEQLRRREERAGAVPVSDLFAHPRFDLLRTINHPGNPIWIELARRMRDRLGLEEHDSDPHRPLLDSIIAPRERAVIEAWQLDDREALEWTVHGTTVTTAAVEQAHLDWYAQNPDLLRIAADRHADALSDFVMASASR